MARYALTKPAFQDLREITRYLRQHSPPAARRIPAELRAKMELIARVPGIGRSRPDLTDRLLLFYSMSPYQIVYDAKKKPLEIVRILHGARDVAAELRRAR